MHSSPSPAPVVLLAVALATCQPGARPHHRDDLAAIRALDEAYTNAVTAQDWDALAALFKRDGILMPPNEPSVVGRAAILERGRGFDITAIEYAHTEVDVGGTSGVGYLQGRYSTSAAFSGLETSVEDRGKYLWIVERQPTGEWLIEKAMWNSDLPLAAVDEFRY